LAVNMIETNKQEDKTKKFIRTLNNLNKAFPYAKTLYQNDVLISASKLMDSVVGMKTLYQYADSFDKAGVFQDSPWEHPAKLQPPLVTGSIKAKGTQSLIEILSELRMLSIAKEKHRHQNVSAEMAKSFLYEVMALNLDFLFPEDTEAARLERSKEIKRAENLFKFLAEELTLSAITGTLIKEINNLSVQRTIMVDRILSMIKKAQQTLTAPDINNNDRKTINRYAAAISGPTRLSQTYTELHEYRNMVINLENHDLEEEARTFAEFMRETGLVSPHHVVLVRYLNFNENKDLLATAMGLNEKGKANLSEHFSIAKELINVAIHPPTRQSLYGLARMLERGVFSHTPVIPGLRRLIELDILPETRNLLLKWLGKDEGLTANDIMVSGAISVLGQPLGVGQGLNPTCQTARGISLWSLHAPGYLLELIPRAARDGDIDMNFEGLEIHSKYLSGGLVSELNIEKLDPISVILAPHLDRIYAEMIRLVQYRIDDAHKWVNPAFYGNWVPRGFSSVFDPATGSIVDYSGFVRLFYATHHPKYNGGHELIYPNPVGIFMTNVFGKMLGFHAVTIQRIARFKEGDYRIYFYNPNNNSSQNWGQGIEPTVQGHDEIPGESSLPFHQFVSRLYAFHYNPYERGDAFAIENDLVETIKSLSRNSWGQEYTWID